MNLQFERGTHICHLFENADEQKAVILPFLKAGLNLGERCTLIVTGPFVDDWYSELQAYDIDVLEKRRKGALEVLEASTWYLSSEFNSIIMARRLWRMIDSALLNSTGVRLVADMVWTSESSVSVDQLCHWEATANTVLDDTDARVICQYDLNRHSPAAIHSALRTHPMVILGGRIIPSPYYEAPEILTNEPYLNRSDADATKIEEMLARLRTS